MAQWLVRDRWNAPERDREQLLAYLSRHHITPHPAGYLHAVVGNSEAHWVDAWRYLSDAAQAYQNHPSIQRRLRKLAEKKWDAPSAVLQHRQHEIDWRGALLEFKALYALTRFFGYQFESFEMFRGFACHVDSPST